jgi:hypothetical protein
VSNISQVSILAARDSGVSLVLNVTATASEDGAQQSEAGCCL